MCKDQKNSRPTVQGEREEWVEKVQKTALPTPVLASPQVTFLLWSAAWGSVSFQKHHQLRHCPIFSTKSKAGSLSRNERREEPETSSQRSIYPYTTLERLKNCLPHPAPLLSCRMPIQMCPCKSSIRWHPPGKTSKCQAKESRCWGSATGRLTKTRKQVLDISGKILILSYSTSARLVTRGGLQDSERWKGDY